MLDRTQGPVRPAELRFHHGEFEIVKAGSHAICAATGAAIPLEELRYWSVERQEAYASPDAAKQRFAGAGR